MKKILSTILAFMTLVSCFAFTTATAKEESKDNTKYISFFSGMGVFNGVYENDSNLTRADFAQILTRLVYKDGALDSYRGEIYKDVPAEHIANKEINYMNLRGILNGKSYDMFYPDDLLTLNEACAGVIRVLGYTSKANSVGFVRTATDLGALKGVTSNENGYITAGSLAKMLFNVLETPIVESYVHNGEKHENLSNMTIFSDYLELEKGYGMVTGVDGLYINSASEALENGQVMIGNKVYETVNLSLSDYFGVYIDFYYKDDETAKNPEILAVISTGKTEELIVYSGDISSADGTSLTYYSEDKEKNTTVKIEKDAFVLYNGKSVVSLTNDYLPENGYVRLVATRGKNYDLIVVYDYQSFVVQSNAKGKIAFKYGRQFTDDKNKKYGAIDLAKDEYEVVVKNGGKNMRAIDIQIGDVVSIAQGGDRFYVEVSSNKVKGVVKGYSDNPEKYLIVGTYYEVDPDLAKLLKTPGNGLAKLEMNLNSTFYIDFMNQIVGYDDSVTALRYGYLKGVLSKGAIDGVVQVKILPAMEKDFVVYDVTDKTLLNGAKSNKKDIYDALTTFIANCEAKTTLNTSGNLTNLQPPIVKFKVKNNELTSIVTKTVTLAAKGSDPGTGEVARDTAVSDDFIILSAPYASKIWNGTEHYRNFSPYNSEFGWVSAKNVACMQIPQSGKEEDFKTDYCENVMPGVDNQGRNVLFYDFNFETANPGLVCWVIKETGSAASPKNGSLYIVEAVSTGDDCAYITCWSLDGKGKYRTTSDDDVINAVKALKKGDVIQMDINSKDLVGVVSKRFSYYKPTGYDKADYADSKTDASGNPNAIKQIRDDGLNAWIAFGEYASYKSNKQSNNMVMLNTESYWTGVNLISTLPTKVTIFDGSEFYVGDINDLGVGDFVFAIGADSNYSRVAVFKYDTPEYNPEDGFHATSGGSKY